MRLVPKIVAVHENVLATGMAVEITIEEDLPLFSKLSNKLLDGKVHRVQYLVWSLPPPVKILATERTSVIPIDDTIRI